MAKPARPKRSSLRLGIEILSIALLVLAVRGWMQRDMVEGPAPPLSGVAVDGSELAVTQFQGRPVLIHFWATWCAICRAQERAVEAIARDHPVITVAMQSGDGTAVAEYMRERDLRFPVLIDETGILAGRYGVRAVPADFVLDGAGTIRFRDRGYSSEWGLRARLWLARTID
jgi:thiol-disulfide isomerase/thioredoxin